MSKKEELITPKKFTYADVIKQSEEHRKLHPQQAPSLIKKWTNGIPVNPDNPYRPGTRSPGISKRKSLLAKIRKNPQQTGLPLKLETAEDAPAGSAVEGNPASSSETQPATGNEIAETDQRSKSVMEEIQTCIKRSEDIQSNAPSGSSTKKEEAASTAKAGTVEEEKQGEVAEKPKEHRTSGILADNVKPLLVDRASSPIPLEDLDVATKSGRHSPKKETRKRTSHWPQKAKAKRPKRAPLTDEERKQVSMFVASLREIIGDYYEDYLEPEEAKGSEKRADSSDEETGGTQGKALGDS